MTRLDRFLGRRLRAGAREDGNASVEFALLFPLFLTLFISSIESGLMSLRYVMLDRSVDLAVRELRLGLAIEFSSMSATEAHDELKTRICSNTLMIPDCGNVLFLELISVNPDAWNIPSPNTQCVDRTEEINPTLNFNPGAANEMMIVRACAVVDPLVPDFGLGARFMKDASGGVALIASSAFVNEPDS